ASYAIPQIPVCIAGALAPQSLSSSGRRCLLRVSRGRISADSLSQLSLPVSRLFHLPHSGWHACALVLLRTVLDQLSASYAIPQFPVCIAGALAPQSLSSSGRRCLLRVSRGRISADSLSQLSLPVSRLFHLPHSGWHACALVLLRTVLDQLSASYAIPQFPVCIAGALAP